MARTVQQIIEAQLASDVVKIAMLTAENEKLKEDLAAAEKAKQEAEKGKQRGR